ncbi:RNA polymerase sigma factor [Corallococcus exiguus]|uniref:RNA polymerase sigma factor n=1 Tax=Corallococcus exiguus TaxID=83462 RepID=UPI0014942058|nr:sigma-70 family RNA polymerase sigma factor [Corallococcus exiguus]NPD26459.1 sigma-70 family RNA polymerase sigma factor [Corallococcus exiguus]
MLRSTSGGGAPPEVDPPDKESDLVLLREACSSDVEARTEARSRLIPLYRERLLTVVQFELPDHQPGIHEELVADIFSELAEPRRDGKRDGWSEFPIGKKWFARWAVTDGTDALYVVRATRGLNEAELHKGRGRLQKSTHERILAILGRRLPGYDHDRLEDLIQQTFSVLYDPSKINSGQCQWCDYDKNKAKFTTWMAVRAHKDAFDLLRKELRREKLLAWGNFSPSSGFDPQQALMSKQKARSIYRALERLEPEQRDLLLDHYGSDLPGYERRSASFPDLAVRYGISDLTLRKRAERARHKLQTLLLEEAERELFTEEDT